MLTERAERDHSTGLANRQVLETTLSHAAATQAWALPGRVVLFIDLDHFKAVNDSFGHAAGDFVLSVVAERIVAAVAEPIDVIGGTASVGASVGLAIGSSGLSLDPPIGLV